MKKFLPTLLIALFFTACTSDKKRMEMEVAAMIEFMDNSGVTYTPTSSGLYYHIDVEGNQNRIPDSTHLVSFKHIGYLIDSSKFSDGWFASDFIPLTVLVEGFQEGLQIIGEGGRGSVVFPSNLGYGEDGATTVPGWSPLCFELELVSYY